MPHSPILQYTLRPCLFDHALTHHVQSGYIYASPSSLPIYARRSTRAQFEYPKPRNNPRRWRIPCNRRSNSLARSSTAAVLAPRALQLPRHLSSVNAGSAVVRAANGPHTRTALLRPCKPLHTSQSSQSSQSSRVHTRGIVYRRLGMRTRPLRVQVPIPPTSALLPLPRLPLLRWLLQRPSN